MPMASSDTTTNQRRRIHNHPRFGQQYRIPSIEVYSSAPSSRSEEQASGSSGNVGGRCRNRLEPTYLPTEFRILSTSHVPHQRRNGHASRPGSLVNSKSTGNLSIEDKDMYGTQNDHQSTRAPVVQHASSFGMLSSSRTSKSQDNSGPTSPTRVANGRRQHSYGSNNHHHHHHSLQQASPPRTTLTGNNTAAMQSQRSSAGRLFPHRFMSVDDDSLDDIDDDDVPQTRSESNHFQHVQNGPAATILGHIIRPSTHETTARRIEIKYCARNDKYKRSSNPTRMKYSGWNSLAYAERNIEWITEHCHDESGEAVMTYLSRKPGTSSAMIEWRFDFSDIGMKVKRLLLKFPFETFEDGHVRAYVKAEGSDDTIPLYSSLIAAEITQMRNWNRFSLIAELSCQRESCAFQHAQLFRQTLKSGFFDKEEDKYQFKIEIELYSMY